MKSQLTEKQKLANQEDERTEDRSVWKTIICFVGGFSLCWIGGIYIFIGGAIMVYGVFSRIFKNQKDLDEALGPDHPYTSRRSQNMMDNGDSGSGS